MALPTIDTPSIFKINEAGDQYSSTLREMLIHAAGVATEDDRTGIAETAYDMINVLRAPGTPQLSYWQVRNYTEVIEAARDYETDVQVDVADENSTDEEKRSAVLVFEPDSLIHAIQYLGK